MILTVACLLELIWKPLEVILYFFVVDFLWELCVIFRGTRGNLIRCHWFNSHKTMSTSSGAVAGSASTSDNDNDDDDDDDDGDDDTLVLTGVEILKHGLLLLGWTEEQLNRESKGRLRKHSAWFQCDFGASHHVVAQIFPICRQRQLQPPKFNLQRCMTWITCYLHSIS